MRKSSCSSSAGAFFPPPAEAEVAGPRQIHFFLGATLSAGEYPRLMTELYALYQSSNNQFDYRLQFHPYTITDGSAIARTIRAGDIILSACAGVGAARQVIESLSPSARSKILYIASNFTDSVFVAAETSRFQVPTVYLTKPDKPSTGPAHCNFAQLFITKNPLIPRNPHVLNPSALQDFSPGKEIEALQTSDLGNAVILRDATLNDENQSPLGDVISTLHAEDGRPKPTEMQRFQLLLNASHIDTLITCMIGRNFAEMDIQSIAAEIEALFENTAYKLKREPPLEDSAQNTVMHYCG